MVVIKDPIAKLKAAAGALPEAVEGTSCNQSSFKVGKKAFLYVGPGAKGIGWTAMFKLCESIPEAEGFCDSDPDKFEVGKGNWVTARFTAESPLPKKVWGRWLKESYQLAVGATSPSGAKKMRGN